MAGVAAKEAVAAAEAAAEASPHSSALSTLPLLIQFRVGLRLPLFLRRAPSVWRAAVAPPGLAPPSPPGPRRSSGDYWSSDWEFRGVCEFVCARMRVCVCVRLCVSRNCPKQSGNERCPAVSVQPAT